MLRPYQEKMSNEARALMRSGVRSMILESPTGSGKTVLASYIVKSSVALGNRVWFITHRRELIRQVLKAFSNVGVPCGVVSAGFMEEPHFPVQICSIQSLKRRYEHMSKPGLIIYDECHHLAAKNWEFIFNQITEAFHIGLTATPQRLDGKGLGKYFQAMVKGPTVSWLIEAGFLSDYKLYAPSTVDMTGIRTTMGDFDRKATNERVDKPTITGSAINEYLKLCRGKRAVVFASSIEHSKHIVEQFRSAGVKAEHVDGETPTEIRDRVMNDFKDGKTSVVSNVELFGEGYDCPAIEAVIMLRPTQSLSMYLQMLGRCLRPAEGKDYAIILDHVGNCRRHGLPDAVREWSLEGNVGKKKSSQEVHVKICPRCFAAQVPSGVCKFCGFKFEAVVEKLREVEGELKEVERAVKIPQWTAQSYEDLITVAQHRGYNHPKAWARHVWNARQRKAAI